MKLNVFYVPHAECVEFMRRLTQRNRKVIDEDLPLKVTPEILQSRSLNQKTIITLKARI